METNMKRFTEYLQESVVEKKYDFRVKIAGDITKENETKLESLLGKFKVSSFKKSATTPVQQFPLDFPNIQNSQVNIYEVTLDYPTTSFELTEYLTSGLAVEKQHLVVRKPGEPLEEYQDQSPIRAGNNPLLTDSDYKESPNAKFEDYYGDKYNTGFVKELNDILKLQRKARGEEIPTEGAAKYNIDAAQNNTSPIKETDYDPRK
jgi:hypothetical protein